MFMRSDFSQMSLANRALSLWTNGIFLCRSQSGGAVTSLYLLNSRFIEVVYENSSGFIHDIQELPQHERDRFTQYFKNADSIMA